jgi:hypothetical protein
LSSPILLLLLDQGSWIRDPGRINIRIRDKHPGSATLLFFIKLFNMSYSKYTVPKPVPGTFLLMRACLEILYRSVVLKCPSQSCLGTLGPEEIHFYTSLPSEMQIISISQY